MPLQTSMGGTCHGLQNSSCLSQDKLLRWDGIKGQVAQSCPTICDHTVYAVYGILHARILEWVQFSSVTQSCPTLCDPMNRSTTGSLSITNSWSSLRFMSIESVMPSSHLILCCPLLLLPPVPPSIRVFSNETTLRMRWPKY